MKELKIRDYRTFNLVLLALVGSLTSANIAIILNIGKNPNTSFFLASLMWLAFCFIALIGAEYGISIIRRKEFLPNELECQVQNMKNQNTKDEFGKISILETYQQYKECAKETFKKRLKIINIMSFGGLLTGFSLSYQGLINHYSKSASISEAGGEFLISFSYVLMLLFLFVIFLIINLKIARKEIALKRELVKKLQSI